MKNIISKTEKFYKFFRKIYLSQYKNWQLFKDKWKKNNKFYRFIMLYLVVIFLIGIYGSLIKFPVSIYEKVRYLYLSNKCQNTLLYFENYNICKNYQSEEISSYEKQINFLKSAFSGVIWCENNDCHHAISSEVTRDTAQRYNILMELIDINDFNNSNLNSPTVRSWDGDFSRIIV